VIFGTSAFVPKNRYFSTIVYYSLILFSLPSLISFLNFFFISLNSSRICNSVPQFPATYPNSCFNNKPCPGNQSFLYSPLLSNLTSQLHLTTSVTAPFRDECLGRANGIRRRLPCSSHLKILISFLFHLQSICLTL